MSGLSTGQANPSSSQQRRDIERLGPWFHNLHLPSGQQTAPSHPLGDFPSTKWAVLRDLIPQQLTGYTALDIGCNAGFYTFELARRGARVVAMDVDDFYLNQAKWAAEQMGLQERVEFRRGSVYDLGRSQERYDLILFMGVFYHLRHPLLALDLVAKRVKKQLVFQTLTMPGMETQQAPSDMELMDRERLTQPGWPRMAFIEHRMANDPTNWWAANHACVLAMLRSSGLRVREQPGHEIYVCEPTEDRDSITRDLVDQEIAEIYGSSGASRGEQSA